MAGLGGMMNAHTESIYNIVPPKFTPQEKPAMHRSSHSGTLPPSCSTFHTKTNTSYPSVSNFTGDAAGKVCPDKGRSNFGRAPGQSGNDPATYMKKFAKSSSVPSLQEVKMANPGLLVPSHGLQPNKKGGVPKASECKPIMNLVTSKNFIVANAVETILAQPKKVGNTTKDYLSKEDYGKVPRYLTQIKRDIDAEYDYIRQLQQQEEEQQLAQSRPLQEEERRALIEGLKAKWEQVNTAYQAETHVTVIDSVGLLKRKEKNEAELANLEKDIEKLNKRSIMVDMIS
eukprot:TRINITY_DN1590_c0_g1_i3.p1 TRINITY_DN1590_c0_g1~~TRINITY_DN1590_c0_g1_i3.p1  ORF type:complete len:286 (-),score=74.78 TRINITY_DN1590_c0_g1_i3:301-1158(-)